MIKANIVGVDEVGRGCIAGPVVVAAVVFDENIDIAVKDSKLLSAKKREELYEQIIKNAKQYSVTYCNSVQIDKINILQATLLAMKEAITKIDCNYNKILVDGDKLPNINKKVSIEAVVKGDIIHPVISCASILAKVTRDRYMASLDKDYPGYYFAKHKGYPSKLHKNCLEKLGAVKGIHRFSYKPVSQIIKR